MADPSAIMDKLNELIVLIGHYGGVVLGYIQKALTFLLWALKELPTLLGQAWAWLQGILGPLTDVIG